MQIEELEQKIKQARKEYWNGDPTISDSEYDQMLLELATIDESHPLLVEIESAPVASGKKVKHPVPLLSLEKCFSFEEMKKWMTNTARDGNEKFIIMPKYDGLACRWYQDIRTLATRGKGGIEGEDITSKRNLIDLVLNSSETIGLSEYEGDVEGELICTESNFAVSTITRSSGKKYKTPRNLVAGVMNTDDITPFIDEKGKRRVVLTLVKYDAVKYVRTLDQLNEEEFENICLEFDKLGVPTDGVVIKVEDGIYGESLGLTSHHPKHSIALKFPDEIKAAELKDVVFQTGKNKITPVAVIDPTIIDDVEVRRITLHNAKFCIENDIQIGDELEIVRSGRVIPKVVGSKPGKNRTSISINSCPSCHGKIEYEEPFLYCVNPDCDGKYAKKIAYSASVLGLDEVGPGTIEKCVEHHGCKNIFDVLTLLPEDFMELDGFAETSANKAYDAIYKVLTEPTPDYKVMAALATSGLGQTIWKKLLVEHTIQDLLSMDIYLLSNINNIGPERANLIYHALHNNTEVLQEMFDCMNVVPTYGEVSNKKKICFSGKFPHPKSHYHAIAESKDLEVVSTINKGVDYLVTTGAMTSKVSKARSYGIRILNLDEFNAI